MNFQFISILYNRSDQLQHITTACYKPFLALSRELSLAEVSSFYAYYKDDKLY